MSKAQNEHYWYVLQDKQSNLPIALFFFDECAVSSTSSSESDDAIIDDSQGQSLDDKRTLFVFEFNV